MMFDPKYVHFMWDDELEDKRCFLADNIGELRKRVEEGREIGSVDDADNSIYPFKRAGISYKFCYYDPLYEIKWAYYVEKKVIQVRFEDEWKDAVTKLDWSFSPDCYRIKGAEQYKEELIAELKSGKMPGPDLSSYKVAIAMWKFVRACIEKDVWVSGISLNGVKKLFLTGFNIKWESECWLCDQVVGICSNCPLDHCNKDNSTWRIVNNYIEGNKEITKDQALLACEAIIYAHTEMLNRMRGKNG